MELHLLENRKIGGYTTFGSVWDRGETGGDTEWELTNEVGTAIPVQSRVTAWWPDGTVKWAAHTADSSKIGSQGKLRQTTKPCATSAGAIECCRTGAGYHITNGRISLVVPEKRAREKEKTESSSEPTHLLAADICLGGQQILRGIYPVLSLEHRRERNFSGRTLHRLREEIPCQTVIDSVIPEETGPLQYVFCYRGRYIGCFDSEDSAGAQRNLVSVADCYEPAEEQPDRVEMPFVIRMYLNGDCEEIRFVHTFLYHGIESRDYLKCMGICFETKLNGSSYNRHVKYATDGKIFHEAATLLNSSYPRLPMELLQRQMDGEFLKFSADSDAEKARQGLPIWNRYVLCQDSAYHFGIRKQTRPECCLLECFHGRRAPGVMAVVGEKSGIMIGMQDFWQKYPSGLETSGLSDEQTKCYAWFYSPEAPAYDFRHYAMEGYQMTSYEGFPEMGGNADGIAVTSECCVKLLSSVVSDRDLQQFADRIQNPTVYVGTPEYYHDKRAFGYWSLPGTDTEVEQLLEKEMDTILSFYKNEVDRRDWYGLFDYGDFMHTYDPIRHCWRYDMGGFAWQNTELVPTYWLWLYFLRTGREDAYTLASAMSRHCSEVDFYHFGPMKGIGSRHNVRHWGCACKEPRVSMAGHHRFYYYLTGDYRIGDVMEDVKDADESMIFLKYYHRKRPDGSRTNEYFVRNGPDWSSFVSNWMTQYERTLEQKYLGKILSGIGDMKAAPCGMASGPEYGYEAGTGHMIYLGDSDNADNTHLVVCMGGPEIWLETADMLQDEEFKRLLADFGRFYILSPEEKAMATNGLIHNRKYGFRYFAADLAAYSAKKLGDEGLAHEVWGYLLQALYSEKDTTGFATVAYAERDGKPLSEIPWIKTNFTAQWCLGVIVALEFIRDKLPKNREKVYDILREELTETVYRRS